MTLGQYRRCKSYLGLLLPGAVVAGLTCCLRFCPLNDEWLVAFVLAAWALIIMPVILFHSLYGHCPDCQAPFGRSRGDYCPRCGRRFEDSDIL